MSTATVTKLKRKAADFEQKKQLDKALALYIQLVDEAGRDLDDADLQIYNRVGDLLMRQSNVSEALAYYEKAVDMYAERGFLNNAIALCNKILRQSPARTTVYYKLGKISAKKGFKSDARKNFLEYADRMQKAGNTDEAFRALKEFADLCPDQDDIRLFLADLLTKEQRNGEAVEQLERLYAKLEAEGRSAEARATMDRIKAIDPDITPRASGAFVTQKSNDLVFLDLSEPVTAAATEDARLTPPSDIAVVEEPETVEVSGVGALEGLAITFFPEDQPAEEESQSPEVEEPQSEAVDGLEIDVASVVIEPVAPLDDLDLTTVDAAELEDPIESLELDLPVGMDESEEDVVTPVEGLATMATTLTDSHPSMAPLIESPPLSSSEFGSIDLDASDEHSATPPHDLAIPSSLPRMTNDAKEEETSPVESDKEAEPQGEEAVDVVAQEASSHDASPEADEDDGHAIVRGDPSRPPSVSESELAAVQSDHEVLGSGEVEATQDVLHDALAERSQNHSARPSALDTSGLEDLVARRSDPEAHPEAAEIEQETVDTPSFGEQRVELPMIDLENQANAEEEESFLSDDSGESIDDLLAAPPSFGEPEDTDNFEPGPLDLAAEPSKDEWDAEPHPEVLIDGEWRDEHVGDLVSGEMFVIGERREATRGPRDGAAFDDLAAAMMYDGNEDDESAPNDHVRGGKAKSTLSFGGGAEQVRRRLELDPANPALRRQLGEILLDEGQKESGLNELEIAVHSYEAKGAYDAAREVVDVILRVTPLSVHHHQKRVEYAVRANDRPQLIIAYSELADALFRCGEPDKSRVVYSRILDLEPGNERARFALGMLSDNPGPARRSDEIPSIDTGLSPVGVQRGTVITPGTLESLVIDLDVPHRPANGREGTPVETELVAPEPQVIDDPELDEEVEAAFGNTPVRPTPVVEPIEAGIEESAEYEIEASIDEGIADEIEEAVAEAMTEKAALPPVPVAASVEEHSHSKPAEPQPPKVAQESAAQVREKGEGGFVDLGDWLRETEPQKSTRMVTQDVAPTGDENADFAEMLRRFKQGVAANVEEEDYSSHYDLGVAFKEMGLIDEAIAEFQKALRGEDHRVRAYEALGQCFVEQKQYQVAVTLLCRALETTRSDDQRLVGVLYLLGFACESMERHTDAVGYYQRVFAVDIEFRDVSNRLAALERKTK